MSESLQRGVVEKYDINAVDMLASKVDTFAQRFDRIGTPNPGSSSSMMYELVFFVRYVVSKGTRLLIVTSQCHAKLQPTLTK